MSITPLCTKMSAVQMKTVKRGHNHDSPLVFASALKPLYPDAKQNVIRQFRCRPVKRQIDAALLRCPKFKYAPKFPRWLGPVSFKDVPKSPATKRQVLLPLDHEQETRHTLAQPEFLEALEKRNSQKSMRRKHHRRSDVVRQRHSAPFDPVEFDRPNRKVKRRSIPFNESTETDPFMLFHDLQAPNSAMKSDSEAYIKQTQEVEAAKEQRYRARRGSPLKPEEIKDLIHMTLNMGIYASPTKRPTRPSEPIDQKSCSLMDID